MVPTSRPQPTLGDPHSLAAAEDLGQDSMAPGQGQNANLGGRLIHSGVPPRLVGTFGVGETSPMGTPFFSFPPSTKFDNSSGRVVSGVWVTFVTSASRRFFSARNHS